MKTLLIALLLISCQQVKISKQIDAKFHQKYPNASNTEWEVEGEYFEVSFDLNNQQCSALFDKNGIWLSTGKEIDLKDLPEALKVFIYLIKKKHEIENIELIEFPFGKTLFQMEADSAEHEIVYKLDSLGNILSRTIEIDD